MTFASVTVMLKGAKKGEREDEKERERESSI